MRLALALALLLSVPPAGARRADSVDNAFKRADAVMDKGRFAEARDVLDDVLAELEADDRRLVRYHERMGACWLRAGKIPEARESFTAALKAAQRLKVSDEWVAKAYAGLGLCLRREDNDAYALKFFKKARAIKVDEGTAMFIEDQIREIEGEPPLPAQ